MTKDDCNRLAQLNGGIKRAKSSVLATAGQILSLNKRIAGTYEEQLNDATVKCLFQAKYWLDQAVGTLEHVIRRSRGNQKSEAPHA